MTTYVYDDPHFANYKEILQVLHLIVSEFESDPSSVACFDLRTVQRAKDAITERKRLETSGREPPLLTAPSIAANHAGEQYLRLREYRHADRD